MTSIHKYSLKAVCIVAGFVAWTIPAMTSCGDDDNGGGGGGACTVQFDPAVTIHPDKAGTAVLLITGPVGTAWTAEITSGGTWVSFDLAGAKTRTGEIGESWQSREIPVYYTANNTPDQRHAQLSFTFDGQAPELLDMTQFSTGQNLYPANNVATWPELPAYKESDDFVYVTHLCPVYNQLENRSFTGRNYTMCFDRTKLGAWWVAYPLHKTYLGSGRPNPDPWAFDPKISSDVQPNIVRYSYVGSYDRGHQIPNADRNADPNSEMCFQTFYCSNVTPQTSNLNQQGWMRLEGLVRDWVCSDTTYVVTGAWWGTNPSTTTTRDGQVCPLPDYYFKVIARTVNGDIRSRGDRLGDYQANQLKSIGFWVRNASGQGAAKDWVKSVSEIEALTGFEFFPTLPDAVKNQKDPASWGL